MKAKLISAVVVGAACLALTAGAAGTASAQVTEARASTSASVECGRNFWYISGDGVRIRLSPGGVALGAAFKGEEVSRGAVNGMWRYVRFVHRPSGSLRGGWVADKFVDLYQPTCPAGS
jgi:hypothetical protein